MAVEDWPSQAKIARLDLSIRWPQSVSGISPLSGFQRRGALAAGFWAGTVVLANMDRYDLQAVSAFIEKLRGRSGVFKLPLAGDFATYDETDATGSGTIASASAGDTSITIASLSTDFTTLKAGTLLAIGAVTDANFQLVEVADDVTVSASFSANIQPALRKDLTSVTVYTKDIQGRFRLAEDNSAPGTFGLGYGAMTIPIVEVPFV